VKRWWRSFLRSQQPPLFAADRQIRRLFALFAGSGDPARAAEHSRRPLLHLGRMASYAVPLHHVLDLAIQQER